MEPKTRGLHHITAITSDASSAVNFYTRVLGLRLVKKTVNFDDPSAYHLYFGDEKGSPGSLITFFRLGKSDWLWTGRHWRNSPLRIHDTRSGVSRRLENMAGTKQCECARTLR